MKKNNIIKLNAPQITCVNDAISVLVSMLNDIRNTQRNESATNSVASAMLAKSLGVDSSVVAGVVDAKSKERVMNATALEVAISKLSELDDATRSQTL